MLTNEIPTQDQMIRKAIADAQGTDEARRFVTLKALQLVNQIVLAFTPDAPEAVRTVYPSPSALDRAIAARVVQLLT